MNTRFSPSLNGSLHLGHLYMAWLNRSFAQRHGGRFLLRFDDLAPRLAGDPIDRMQAWAAEAESLLRHSGLVPDAVTYLSVYSSPAAEFPDHVGGKNRWLRPANYEGHFNLSCSPALVAARVSADIAEEIGVVIRGEELLQELQLYEYFNARFGGATRELVYVPRLRVRCAGNVTTISKTVGNLQLRDLFCREAPEVWLERVRRSVLLDPSLPVSWENLNRDPLMEVEL